MLLSQNVISLQIVKAFRAMKKISTQRQFSHPRKYFAAFSLPDKLLWRNELLNWFLIYLLSSVPISFFPLFSLPPSPCLSVVRPFISPVYGVVIQDNMLQHLSLHMMPDLRHWPSLYHTTHTHTHLISHTHPYPPPLTSAPQSISFSVYPFHWSSFYSPPRYLCLFTFIAIFALTLIRAFFFSFFSSLSVLHIPFLWCGGYQWYQGSMGNKLNMLSNAQCHTHPPD